MKAVITTGGKQYIVSKDDVLDIELIPEEKKVTFEPLLLIDGKETTVGTPSVSGHSVEAEVIGTIRADKVTAIRYKAKKRVKKVHGHRQTLTQIKITSIK